MVPADSTFYALTLLAVKTQAVLVRAPLQFLEKTHTECKKESSDSMFNAVGTLTYSPTSTVLTYTSLPVPYQIRVNTFLMCTSKCATELHCLKDTVKCVKEHTSKSSCSQHTSNQ